MAACIVKLNVEDLERRARLVIRHPDAYANLAPTVYETLALIARNRQLERVLRDVMEAWIAAESVDLADEIEILEKGAVL